MKPVGHRVLVRPDEQPEVTASGLILPQDHDHVPVSGTVVALGPGGSQMRYQARQRALRDALEIIESAISQWGAIAALTLVRDEISGRLGTSDPVHDVAIGDRVVFPVDVGLNVSEDGQDYILINEDDIAGIAADEDVAA